MGVGGVWGASPLPLTTIIQGPDHLTVQGYNHPTNLLEVQHGQAQDIHRFSHLHGSPAGSHAHVLRLPRPLTPSPSGLFSWPHPTTIIPVRDELRQGPPTTIMRGQSHGIK